jgi:hypothetical protein
MLEAMRYHYDAKNLDRAAELAKDAAPYCHAKYAPIEAKKEEEVDLDAAIEEELGLAKMADRGQAPPAVPLASTPSETGVPPPAPVRVLWSCRR